MSKRDIIKKSSPRDPINDAHRARARDEQAQRAKEAVSFSEKILLLTEKGGNTDALAADFCVRLFSYTSDLLAKNQGEKTWSKVFGLASVLKTVLLLRRQGKNAELGIAALNLCNWREHYEGTALTLAQQLAEDLGAEYQAHSAKQDETENFGEYTIRGEKRVSKELTAVVREGLLPRSLAVAPVLPDYYESTKVKLVDALVELDLLDETSRIDLWRLAYGKVFTAAYTTLCAGLGDSTFGNRSSLVYNMFTQPVPRLGVGSVLPHSTLHVQAVTVPHKRQMADEMAVLAGARFHCLMLGQAFSNGYVYANEEGVRGVSFIRNEVAVLLMHASAQVIAWIRDEGGADQTKTKSKNGLDDLPVRNI